MTSLTGWIGGAGRQMLRRIIDQQMADTLGIKGPSSSNAFLTEPQDTEIEAEKDEALGDVGWCGDGWSEPDLSTYHFVFFWDVWSLFFGEFP